MLQVFYMCFAARKTRMKVKVVYQHIIFVIKLFYAIEVVP